MNPLRRRQQRFRGLQDGSFPTLEEQSLQRSWFAKLNCGQKAQEEKTLLFPVAWNFPDTPIEPILEERHDTFLFIQQNEKAPKKEEEQTEVLSKESSEYMYEENSESSGLPTDSSNDEEDDTKKKDGRIGIMPFTVPSIDLPEAPNDPFVLEDDLIDPFADNAFDWAVKRSSNQLNIREKEINSSKEKVFGKAGRVYIRNFTESTEESSQATTQDEPLRTIQVIRKFEPTLSSLPNSPPSRRTETPCSSVEQRGFFWRSHPNTSDL